MSLAIQTKTRMTFLLVVFLCLFFGAWSCVFVVLPCLCVFDAMGLLTGLRTGPTIALLSDRDGRAL